MERFSNDLLKISLEKKRTGQPLSPLEYKYLLWDEYRNSQSRLEQDYDNAPK